MTRPVTEQELCEALDEIAKPDFVECYVNLKQDLGYYIGLVEAYRTRFMQIKQLTRLPDGPDSFPKPEGVR